MGPVSSSAAGARHGRLVWLDGRLVAWAQARPHLMTHALHHGTAVFEGLRCYVGEHGPALFRLDDHLARMERSARAVLIDLPYDRDELIQAALAVVREAALGDCYLRPIAFRGYGVLGLSPDNSPTSVGFAAWDAVPLFRAQGESGVRLTLSQWRRPGAQHAPTGAKASGLYLTIALAKAEAQRAGFDDALMLSDDGSVAEATVENVFVVADETLLTPPESVGILPGITRATVIALAQELGIGVEERPLELDEVLGADEVLLTGTAAEVVAVSEIDGRRFAAAHPVTRALQDAYARTVCGRNGHHEWLTPVGC